MNNLNDIFELIANKLINDMKYSILEEKIVKIKQDLNAKILLLHEVEKYKDIKNIPRDGDFFMGIPILRAKNNEGFLIEVFSMDAREVIDNSKTRSNLWN